MGLWSWLKSLWNWLWNGAGFGVDELARRLKCRTAELRAVVPAYREFMVPKRAGGKRRLCAPDDALKALQRRILHTLLRKLKVHPAATGFERGQSIVTHARRHAGQAVVVRLDVKEFFPTTWEWRVRRYFRNIGWNRPAARLLTRLCTHQGGLPQGAPTSPRLSNLVNYRMDSRLAGLARKVNAVYSRYADDMTLSFAVDDGAQVRWMIRQVRHIVNAEGYRLHGARKLKIRRRHQQQRVTGLVVNETAKLPRATRRRLRAAEHRLRTGRPALLTPEQLAGWRAFAHMVATQALDPAQAEALRKERDALQGTWLVVAAEEHGRAVAAAEFAERFAGVRWHFAGDRLNLEQGGERVSAAFRLGASATPRTIDLTPTAGPQLGRSVRGIYERRDGELSVCLNHGTGKRPNELATVSDRPSTLLILRRDPGHGEGGA